MRFKLIENDTEFPNDGEICWYWDTDRPLRDDEQPFVVVQCYCDRDPNQFVRHDEMALLFTDQAEYFAVCLSCYYGYSHMQWSGSTRNPRWQQESARYLQCHIKTKGWCEFCDPVFGNGGWIRK